MDSMQSVATGASAKSSAITSSTALPWATDLNARQTKQAVFLDKPRVKIERFYSLCLQRRRNSSDEESFMPRSMLAFENRKASGLGEPLPGRQSFGCSKPSDTGDIVRR